MRKDESVAAYSPGADVLEQQIPESQQEGFVYERLDGTVEHARSEEEVIRLCPVIGRIARESPETAKLLLGLSAAGNKMIKDQSKEVRAETQKETGTETGRSKQMPTINADKQPKEAKEELFIRNSEKTKEEWTRAARQDVLAAAGRNELQMRHSHEELPKAGDDKNKTEPQRKFAAKAKPEPPRKQHAATTDKSITRPKTVKHKPSSPSKAKPSAPPKITQIKTQNHYEKKKPAQPIGRRETEAPKTPVTLEKVEDTKYPKVAAAEIIHSEDASAIEDFESTLYAEPEYPWAELTNDMPESSGEASEQAELVYDTETMDTFEQLLAHVETEPGRVELSEVKDAEAAEAEPEAVYEAIDTAEFEEFIADNITEEKNIGLEAIQENADEQPLEETLLQLVKYFAEPTIEVEQEISVLSALREVEETMPACYRQNKEGESLMPIPTPEIVHKLLALLHALGYNNPKEVLVGFVAGHDLAYLLQAIHYMYQLSNAENRQELLMASTSFPGDDDSRQRLSKAIFGLVMKIIFEPNT